MLNLKIIVTGPFSSGKTEFIRAVSEQKVVSIDVPIDHISMDHGVIEVDNDSSISLLGTYSGRRFSFDWHVTKEFLIGYVIIVDSAEPKMFREAKRMIEVFIELSHEPLVIAANKQDKGGAWGIDDLRLALNIPAEIPVLPCVTSDKESVKRMLVALVDEVLKVLIVGKARGKANP